MLRVEVREERYRILEEIDALNRREEAGEDVAEELLTCGRRLIKLSSRKPRKDVMVHKEEKLPTVSKELIDRAAKNGITKIALENRIRYGWHEELAVTKPMRNRGNPELLALAKRNGINSNTFFSRMQKGWSEEQASTEPLTRKQYEELSLTLKEYQEMKDSGMTDRQIAQELETTMHRLYKFKTKNGISRKYEV